MTVEIGGLRVLTDPVLVDSLAHLVRRSPSPASSAASADLVLVSHLHLDHFHVRSLRMLAAGTRVLVPVGSATLLARTDLDVREVRPGDLVTEAGLEIEVHAVDHPASRYRWSRRRATPLGFRTTAAGGRTFWFPGDTGPAADVSQVGPVDLALLPVGGWGPTLGPDHLDPGQAASMAHHVRARWALPVHWGTFWPRGMGSVAPAVRRRLFDTPGERFAEALRGTDVRPVLAAHGQRTVLDP